MFFMNGFRRSVPSPSATGMKTGKPYLRGIACLAAILIAAAEFPTAAALSSGSHTHSFYSAWESDAQNHWHAASCAHTSEKDNYGPHRWNDGVVTVPATPAADGTKKYTCTVCGATKTEQYPFEEKTTSLLDISYVKHGKLWLRTDNPPKKKFDTPGDPNWSVSGRMGCTVGTVRDAQGNQYKYGFHLDDSTANEKDIVVYLDCEYTRLTGTVAFPGDPVSSRAGLRDKNVWIYLDDNTKPAFACVGFGKYQDPVPFDIDVTGVVELRIVWGRGEEPNEAATIYDAFLFN